MTERTNRSTSALVALVAVLVAACTGGGSPSMQSVQPSAGGSAPAAGVQKLLVDTDVAPDDLIALSFLLTAPGAEVVAITVSGTGEAHCQGGVEVVLRLLERLDAPEIPVACGRENPLSGGHAFPDDWRAAADSGSGLTLPASSRQPFPGAAVQLIAEMASATDGLRILTLGPVTNLGDAILADASLVERIESVYVMGGALFVPGNVAFGGPADNQVAEWNIYVDPHAAAVVVGSRVMVRMIGLDGTNQVPVTREYARRVQDEAIGPASQVMAELFATHPFMTDGTYYLWDPLAAALAAGHPLGTFTPARIEVEETEGPEVGFTRPVDGSANIDYLSAADQAAAENAFLER